MTIKILFVQGGGKDVHDAWDNKLVDSLKHALGRGFSVIYPRMPKEADPRFSSWKTKLRQAFEALDDGDILAGHSVGATVLLHALADRPPPFRPAALVLIAPPFIGDGGWPSDDIDAKADFSTLPRDMPVFLYHGGKDETVPVAHMELYAKALPGAVITHIPGADHQLDNDLSRVAKDISVLSNPKT